MKVEEAKKKVCPFMSNTFAADTPDLRNGGLIEQCCICDDCMAWKWKTLGDDPEWCKKRKEQPKANPEGYCKRIEG